MPTISPSAAAQPGAPNGAQNARGDSVRTLLDKLRPEAYLPKADATGEVDKLLSSVISELALGVRVEVAHRISQCTIAFNKTARELAFDDIAVAKPVLENSQALKEEDLLDVIANTSQAHMMALTKRASISEKVSDALVDKGEDNVVASLLGNEGAQIAIDTYDKVAVRAEGNPELQGPLIARSSVPLDLLNELYFAVESDFRREILKRYDAASTHDLSLALLQNRRRWLVRHGGLPPDYETVRFDIEKLERRGELKPPVLLRLLRERKQTAFKLALARLSRSDYELINRVFERKDFDALAMIARASGFDRPLFVTLALSLADSDQRMSRAEEFGELFESIPADLAHKVLCLWKTGLDGDAEDSPRH